MGPSLKASRALSLVPILPNGEISPDLSSKHMFKYFWTELQK